MEAQPQRKWGVTNPITEAQPTEADLKLNTELLDELKRENNFETAEGTERRVKVLDHLQKVGEAFVRKVCSMKGLSKSVIDNAGGRIVTFGSYALGVFGPGSDIDTLLVAPKHIDLDDFYKHFVPILEEMSPAENIQDLVCVPEAYVPVITMMYNGVSIDLLFVSLHVQSVPKDMDLTDKSVLRGLDDSSMRSINGIRVTTELKQAVPQIKTLRHALRAIKLWAQRRGVYGNKYGYPGGIAWAILVARICQLYPFACGATVVSKFFTLMLKWAWPRPVMLKDVEPGTMGLRVWNPQIYHQDRSHLMPIITPAFPAMCATHNISVSTKSAILSEMGHADEIMHSIVAGKRPWKDLFRRHTFFTEDHKYYLSIIAASRTEETRKAWTGWVESKVRILVKTIDESDAGVDIARPYCKPFNRVHRYKTDEELDRILQGRLEFQVKESEDAVDGVASVDDAKAATTNGDAKGQATNGQKDSDDAHTIQTQTYYIGISLNEGAKSLDISYPVQEFKRTVTSWTNYDSELHSIRIIHTRNYDLPEDCFEPGETRPMKPKKKTKRSFADTGLDDAQKVSAKRRQSANGVATPA